MYKEGDSVSEHRRSFEFDVVGMGLNAVDHICLIPRFPRYEEKLRMDDFRKTVGGQVATALVACARWGLKTKYIGKVGGGEMGAFSLESLKEEGVDVSNVTIVSDVLNQFAFILVDASAGERTIIWKRDQSLAMLPEDVPLDVIKQGQFLFLDGHDAKAAALAAKEVRGSGVKVVIDAETVKAGTRELVQNADFVVCSREFPLIFTGETALERALEKIKERGPVCAVSTLGKEGALCLCDTGFLRSRGFKVHCVDSTGAGDVFHGAFIYGLAKGWYLQQVLDFSNAAAALNCTEIGARGGIKTIDEIFDLLKTGDRW